MIAILYINQLSLLVVWEKNNLTPEIKLLKNKSKNAKHLTLDLRCFLYNFWFFENL